jgi:hypothetical protein
VAFQAYSLRLLVVYCAKKLLEKSIDFWARAKVKRLSAQNVILQFKNQVKRTTPNEKTN